MTKAYVSSSFFISMVVSPFWNFTPSPSSMARNPYRRVGNRSNSPTAVRMEPSMTPIGGTKKPPTISPTDTKKQIANVPRLSQCWRVSSACFFSLSFIRAIIVMPFLAFRVPISMLSMFRESCRSHLPASRSCQSSCS